LMAGGSCPSLPVLDNEFLKAAALMEVKDVKSDKYKMLVKSGTGIIIFTQSKSEIPIQLEQGKYQLKYIDSKSGIISLLNKSVKGDQIFNLNVEKSGTGVYWFQKL